MNHDVAELNREADHRIANNLASLSSVVRLQRNSIAERAKNYTAMEVCALLDDFSARIEVMGRLHQVLARSVKANGVNLGHFLEEICAMIDALAPEGHLNLTINNSSDGYIHPRHALHAGLIAAELLTNASKYAHPSGLPVMINVDCQAKSDGSFVVEITDDGVGFPETFDTANDGGLGFQIMRALANGLQAELQFEHGSLGVCARIVKPAYLAS